MKELQCRALCAIAQAVIPTGATALFAVAEWRDRGNIARLPSSVIPNGVREARLLRPVRFAGVRNLSSLGLFFSALGFLFSVISVISVLSASSV